MADVLAYSNSIPRRIEEALMEEEETSTAAASSEGTPRNLQIRTRAESECDGEAGALVVHTGGDLTPKGSNQPQDQLTELLQELGTIEAQQEKLRDAVKHNKGIVVHPRHEVLEESESEHGETPKAPTPKKRLVVSGGLTGFGIAQDLLQIDFSPPEEAPEEFKAVAFYEEPKQIKPGLSGSFGLCDPASKEMHHYLERLEEQQKLVLELITGKKQALIEHMQSKDQIQIKQGGRAKGAKSRLGRTARLEEAANKAAMADALGLSPDKEMSLGAKMGSLALGSKGALTAKLPIIAASNLPRSEEKPARRETKPVRAIPPQVRQIVPKPVRRAQVQKEELEAKEYQEIQALFAQPLPGSTPSTWHLAGKQAAKDAAAQAASEGPSEANPYFSHTPQKQKATAKASSTPKMPSTPGGRVSNFGQPEEDDRAAPVPAVEQKSRLFGGLRKLMKSKSKA